MTDNSKMVETIRDDKDPLNLQIVFNEEIYEQKIKIDLIHDKENRQINVKIIFNEEMYLYNILDSYKELIERINNLNFDRKTLTSVVIVLECYLLENVYRIKNIKRLTRIKK